MNCKERQYLEDYLDGLLSGPERLQFEEHLDSCPSCRREVQLERSLGNLLKDRLSIHAPAGFSRQLLKRLVAEESSRRIPDWLWATGLGLVVASMGIVAGKLGDEFVQKIFGGLVGLITDSNLVKSLGNLESLAQSDWLPQLASGTNVLILNLAVGGVVLCWGLWQVIKALRG